MPSNKRTIADDRIDSRHPRPLIHCSIRAAFGLVGLAAWGWRRTRCFPRSASSPIKSRLYPPAERFPDILDFFCQEEVGSGR